MKTYWITLPVKNIEETKTFYKNIGFEINEERSNEDMVSVMLNNNPICFVSHKLMKMFMNTDNIGNHNGEEVLISIDVSTKEEVNNLLNKVIENKGEVFYKPNLDDQYYGFGFSDPSGHRLNIIEFNY